MQTKQREAGASNFEQRFLFKRIYLLGDVAHPIILKTAVKGRK